MKHAYDIAIVGSGFAGSLLAMIAQRLGHSVILLEKSRHPRFAIGESSTPLANLLLEELVTRYDLPQLLPLTKWGSWQRAHPDLAVGLKRGFSFYHHTFNQPFAAKPDYRDQLLVAASPHDAIADTHWYRADFDHFFVRTAQAMGVTYLDEAALRSVSENENTVTLQGERQGEPLEIEARFVVDATGPRGFLHRALQLPEHAFEHLPPTQALFTHVTGAHRLENILALDETPPYPIDDAALHHVFDGGWIWVLRFNNGITSMGVAAKSELTQELNFAAGAPAWKRLLERLPTVREQLGEAQPQLPWIHAPQLSFRSGVVAGQRWVLLPSAAGFIDPLLSTGFPLTLLGVTRIAQAIEQEWETPRFAVQLHAYETETIDDLLAAELLVAALYTNLNDFPTFTALSRLYFAAVSFAETACRLGRPQLADSFLLRADPNFGPASRACLQRALQPVDGKEKAELLKQIHDAIEPIDVAGLNQPRRNWYPVEADDLFAGAAKLGVEAAEVEQLLQRSGFHAPQVPIN